MQPNTQYCLLRQVKDPKLEDRKVVVDSQTVSIVSYKAPTDIVWILFLQLGE